MRNLFRGMVVVALGLCMSARPAIADDSKPSDAGPPDPQAREKIDALMASYKARQIAPEATVAALNQFGEPAQPEVFQILLQYHLSNTRMVQNTVKSWNDQHMVVSDAFRPAALKLVPQILQTNRRETVQVLSLFGPLPELEPAYLQLSVSLQQDMAKAAMDRLLEIDPRATNALPFYEKHLTEDNLNNKQYVFRALSWLGEPATPTLLEATRATNVDDRVAAIRALEHQPDFIPGAAVNRTPVLSTPPQAVIPEVLARAKELLHGPSEGLANNQQGFAHTVCFDTMDLLDSFGRAGRKTAIDCMWGNDAVPPDIRTTILIALGYTLPALNDLRANQNLTDPEWKAAQTLAAAINEDTPDECFAFQVFNGRRTSARSQINRMGPAGRGPSKNPCGEHTAAAALALLNDSDPSVAILGARVLSIAGQLSSAQFAAMCKALVTASPQVQQKLTQAALTNADFSTPEAAAFADTILMGSNVQGSNQQAQTTAIATIATNNTGRAFLADRLAADPPLSTPVVERIIATLCRTQFTGGTSELTGNPRWESAKYRTAVVHLLHKLDGRNNDPAALGEVVSELQAEDSDARVAAAAFLAMPEMAANCGPVTLDKVRDVLGETDTQLIAPNRGPIIQSPTVTTTTSIDTPWLSNASIGFWICSGLLMAGVSIAAIFGHKPVSDQQ